MSDRHHAWLVVYPAGQRRFATLAAAWRYLAVHEIDKLGPATLVGLVPPKEIR